MNTTRMLSQSIAACVSIAAVLAGGAAAAEWKPAEGPLMTRWAQEVSPENVHPEYPRPQLVRDAWQNLNGLWQYAIRPKDEPQPTEWDGEILVPFPVESALSGVMQRVGPENRLWYRRTFRVPEDWRGRRVLLHFGAVDWETTVLVNGQNVGEHRGGYDPFSFDITDALPESDQHEVVVSVWDPSDAGFQPRGKQVQNPHGIWYTPVTGIWQTVWLEPVPEASIESVRFVPDVDGNSVRIKVQGRNTRNRHAAFVTIRKVSKGDTVETIGPIEDHALTGEAINLALSPVKLWSPGEPWIYHATVRLVEDTGKTVDVVTGYFGLRKIEVRKDDTGINRLFLNNEPLFQFGLLDQGWWPDGLYAAPTDEALRYDIEVTKRLGFNMARKHVKVEPARWYYWCDKLGLLVWQDMPNGDRHIRPDQPDIERSPESAENFRREWKAIIDALRNHPAIVVWVPFNEGWGQFQTNEILAWTKQYDPTRLVDGPSGWADRGTGDLHDIHRYPGPGMPPLEEKRAAVLGEFGGLGLPLEGHTWLDRGNWGYRTYQTREELVAAYKRLIAHLRPLIAEGLAAAVYTQTTDVEIEVNGVMTYDRAVIKLPEEEVAALHATLYAPPSRVTTVIPTSRREPQEWKYTTTEPADGWEQPGFDDSQWQTGPGGFGTRGTPGAVVRTEWNTSDIWLRRTFELDEADLADPHLRIHHDENASVYLNGQLIATFEGYTVNYILSPLDEKARRALRAGTNALAVHCHQTGGGQYIDVGIADLVPGE